MKRKYPAPSWKVGDTVYFKWDSGRMWQEKVVVGETPRSWLLLSPGYSAYQADPTHWRWPSYCEKLPKCGYGNDDHWQTGTKTTKVLTLWVMRHREKIIHALQWNSTLGYDATFLRDLALQLELSEPLKDFPTEDTHVETKSDFPVATQAVDGNGRSQA